MSRGKQTQCKNAEQWQVYLEKKAETNSSASLKKTLSHLIKLEKVAKAKDYKKNINWETDNLYLPASRRTFGVTKDKPMDMETSQKIIDDMKRPGTHSEVYRSVELSRTLGLRVDETVHMKVGQLHFEATKDYTLGYAEIKKGDGSKGNRPRIIPIQTKEELQRLKELCKDHEKNDYIVKNSKNKNEMMNADSVSKAFNRTLYRIGLENYKGNLNHALRKDWAQRSYNLYRDKKNIIKNVKPERASFCNI